MRFRSILLGATALALIAPTALADVVTDWNQVAVGVGRRLKLGPNKASRLVAITHLAAYDAVVSVTRTHEPYLGYALVPDGPVSLEAAVAKAAHDVLLLLQPTDAAELDFQLEQSLSKIADGPAKQNGLALGFLAAASLVYERVDDGSADVETYDQPADPGAGKWRPTPLKPVGDVEPAGLPAAQPEWRGVTPFGLLSPSQFRAPAPPALTDAAYTAAFDAVKELGALASATRTAEQTTIVNFWRQETHIPWNAIARSVSNREGLTLEQNARLFALLNIALADSRVATWETKYTYGTWRPITAIRLAESDGNDETAADETWVPYLETPNHPDYVSGHSATGAAGSALLAAVFGDETSFTVASDTLVGVARSFESFSAAAQENADSRLYGGIHFGFANSAGLALGNAIGEYVALNSLLPVDNGGEGGAGGEGGSSGSGASGEGGVPAVGAGGQAGSGDGASGEGGASQGGAPSDGGGAGGEDSGNAAGAAGLESSQGGSGGSSAGKGGGAGKGGSAGSAGKGGGAGSAAKGGSAGSSSGGDSEDDGCSCAVPGGKRRSSSAAWALALAAGVMVARRRRSRG